MAAEKNSTPTTTFNFIQRQGRPEKLVAEVEIVFGEDAWVHERPPGPRPKGLRFADLAPRAGAAVTPSPFFTRK
jgi:hypothetical protein